MTVNPGRHGPYPGRLDPDGISAYAAATGDDTGSVVAGLAVPVIFPVILVFTAVEAARADYPRRPGSGFAAACTVNTTLCCTDLSNPGSR